MKKYFGILLLIAFAFTTYSQQVKDKGQKLPSEYLKKSRKLKTTGFILLGSGVAMITGGALAMSHSTSKGGTEGLIILGGLTMATTSIPFFILSASNKRKANLYMKREALLSAPGIRIGVGYNSVGVRIDL
ncbi:MAG TPA: hypothetical protein VF144_11200 [Chitinophagaceae bacterium]